MNETIRRRPPPTLTPSASIIPKAPAAQAQFSSTGAYVLSLSSTSDGYLFSGSDDCLKYYDASLQAVRQLPSTQKGLTGLGQGAAQGGFAAFSCAKDGTVVGWDLRDTTRCAFTIKGKTGAPYLVCSQSADLNCLAVGAELHHHEATIDLWDLRTLSLQSTYSEAHSDDLTALHFHPTLPHLLLSGSVDGLMNTYDVRIADEDDAVLSTAQVGASVSQSGWMGRGGEMSGVWSSTTIETVMFWDATDFTQVEDLGDVRDVALQPWRSDYLITCFYDATLDGLCTLTGTQKGDIALINLKDPQNWVLETILPSVGGRTLGGVGHSDIVRCAGVDSKNAKIVTGGEDGRICLWSL